MLQLLEGGQHPVRRAIEALGDLVEVGRQVSRFVEEVDEVQADRAVDGVVDIHLELLGQQLAQTPFLLQGLLQAVFVAIEILAPATARPTARRPIHAGEAVARPGIGPGVLVRYVEGRLVGADRVEGDFVRGGGHIAAAVHNGLLGPVRRLAIAAVVALEKWVALELRLQIGGQLDIRQLQQFYRLLQLRRHDQRLCLPQIQSCAERHYASD